MAATARVCNERWCKGVAFYDVHVTSGGDTWTTCKRYSDFVSLDELLESKSKAERLGLPAKGCLGVRHRLGMLGFNQQRLAQLDSYLSHAVGQAGSLRQCPVMQKFLVIPSAQQAAQSDAALGGAVVRAAHDGAELSKPSRPPRAPRPLPYFEPHFGPDVMNSRAWTRYAQRDPALAAMIERCALAAGNQARFENESEDVFKALRQGIMSRARSSSISRGCGVDLDEVPAKLIVWDFVVLVAARRPFFRGQAAEVGRMLEARSLWAVELHKHKDLHGLRKELWRD